MHAVSVGEVLAARPVIAELRAALSRAARCSSRRRRCRGSSWRAAASPTSTASSTFPFDWTFTVRRTLDLVQAAAVRDGRNRDLAEPAARVPSPRRAARSLVNGRISPRSFPRYRLIRPFFRRVLADIDRFCVQGDETARRLVQLGADPSAHHRHRQPEVRRARSVTPRRAAAASACCASSACRRAGRCSWPAARSKGEEEAGDPRVQPRAHDAGGQQRAADPRGAAPGAIRRSRAALPAGRAVHGPPQRAADRRRAARRRGDPRHDRRAGAALSDRHGGVRRRQPRAGRRAQHPRAGGATASRSSSARTWRTSPRSPRRSSPTTRPSRCAPSASWRTRSSSLMGDPVRRARLGAAARALVDANRGAKDKTLAVHRRRCCRRDGPRAPSSVPSAWSIERAQRGLRPRRRVCAARGTAGVRTRGAGSIGPVISVGNLVVGGSGKTPVVAALARMLLRRGRAARHPQPRLRAPRSAPTASSWSATGSACSSRSSDRATSRRCWRARCRACRCSSRRIAISPARWPSAASAAPCCSSTTGFSICSWRATSTCCWCRRRDLDERVLPSGRCASRSTRRARADALLVSGTSDDAARVSSALGVTTAFRVETTFGAAAAARRRRGAGAGRRARRGRGRHRAAGALLSRAFARRGGTSSRELRFRDHHWFTPTRPGADRRRRAGRARRTRGDDREGCGATAAQQARAVGGAAAAASRSSRPTSSAPGCADDSPPSRRRRSWRGRPVRYRLELRAWRGSSARRVRVLPMSAVRALRRRRSAARCTSWTAFTAASRSRTSRTRFPTRSAAERRALARAMFAHFGALLLELLKFGTLSRRRRCCARIEIEGEERVRQALSAGPRRAVLHRTLRLLGDAGDRAAAARASRCRCWRGRSTIPHLHDDARADPHAHRQHGDLPAGRDPQGAARARRQPRRRAPDRSASPHAGRGLRGLLPAARRRRRRRWRRWRCARARR